MEDFYLEEAVQFQYPVFEASEIEELLSLLQEPRNSASPNSGSEESSHAIFSVDEKKRRRMLSNRESARRSRWRKKRHLENLTNQMNRLKLENRELKNRLGLVSHQCHVIWRENDLLSSEFLALRARLSNLCQLLL